MDRKKLFEDRAYHLRQKALVVCPASLKKMWEGELSASSIAATVITQEQLGQREFDVTPYADVDVIVVDEAHNFRNHRAQRYQNLEFLITAQNRRGRSGDRKKVILLTATPINNSIFDLYNEISLFTGGDRGYFTAIGIGDLYRYFLTARQKSIEEGSIQILTCWKKWLFDEHANSSNAHIRKQRFAGKHITWPERRFTASNMTWKPLTKASIRRSFADRCVYGCRITTWKHTKKRPNKGMISS